MADQGAFDVDYDKIFPVDVFDKISQVSLISGSVILVAIFALLRMINDADWEVDSWILILLSVALIVAVVMSAVTKLGLAILRARLASKLLDVQIARDARPAPAGGDAGNPATVVKWEDLAPSVQDLLGKDGVFMLYQPKAGDQLNLPSPK